MIQNRLFLTALLILLVNAFSLPSQTHDDMQMALAIPHETNRPVASYSILKMDKLIPIQDTGKVAIIQDRKIDELVNKHVEINSKAAVKGYRVKIHFGADKNKAKEVKAKFMTQFPTVAAYEKYDQPNFNIRVGDFRTKLEAYKFLKGLQAEFPSAFIVQDEIEFPEQGEAEKK